VGGQRHAPGALLQHKRPGTIFIGAWMGPGWSGMMRKISLTQGFDPWTVHPIVSRYTDQAIPALIIYIYNTLNSSDNLKVSNVSEIPQSLQNIPPQHPIIQTG